MSGARSMTPEQRERKREIDHAYRATHRVERYAAARAWYATHPAYYAGHRVERNAAAHAWRAAHPAEQRTAGRAYREAHREELRERSLARYIAHRAERIAAVRAWQIAHPDERNATARAWQIAHPEERRASDSRRRALKAGSGGRHSGAEWLELVARVGGRCAYCSIAPVGALHRDHDVPLASGGTDHIANIVPACARCNLRKGTMTGAEFRARLVREASA